MTTSYEQAEAHVAELTAKRESWAQKQTQLVNARADLQRSAGAAALEGTPTAKIADQMTRLGAEIDIATSALATLDTQIAAAKLEASLARILDQRVKVVTVLQEGAEKEAAIAPLLDQIEALTGLRYYHVHTPGMVAGLEAMRLLGYTERAEDRLPDDVRARLEVQRDTAPTDVDRAIFAFQHRPIEVPT